VLTYSLLFAVVALTMDSPAAKLKDGEDAPPTTETVVSLTANTSVPTTTSARPVDPAIDGAASVGNVEVPAPSGMVTTRKLGVLNVATNAYKFPLLIARAGMSVAPVMVYVATAVVG